MDNKFKKIIRAGAKDYSTFHFSWTLTNWCNYSCTYCSAKSIMVDKWNKQESISKYKFTLARLKNFDAPFEIELYGGEPSLHPNIEEIITELKKIYNCKKILIITNLSKSFNFWKNIINLGALVCASYHPEYSDNQFLEKIKSLKEIENSHIRVTVNLIDNKEYWSKTIDFIDQLTKFNIDYNLHYLVDTPFWKGNFTKEFFDTFEPIQNDNINRITCSKIYNYEFEDGTLANLKDLEIYKLNYHRFKGFKCRPLFYDIDFEGNIKNSCIGKNIKSLIIKKDLLDREEICPRDHCACEDMFNFYKEAP